MRNTNKKLQRTNTYKWGIAQKSGFSLNIKSHLSIYLYYLVLLIVLISWTNVTREAPPIVARVIYTVLFFIPFIKNNWLMPFAVTLFWSIRTQSVAPFGYLPTESYLYLFGVLGVLIVRAFRNQDEIKNRLSPSAFYLVVYIFVMDTIYHDFFSKYMLMILLGALLYNQIKKADAFNLLAISFVVFSFVQSTYYFVFREDFSQKFVSSIAGLERSTWVDPNYLGIILGMGIIISLSYLLGYFRVKLNNYYKIFFIITILLTFLTITLQASRGAMLALSLPVILLILFSKLKPIYKIGVSVFVTAFLVFLFNNNYFELLIARVETDDGTGGGRIDIWLNRLANFKNEDPLAMIFGLGREYGLKLGGGRFQGSHNEFISTLVVYGIVGLLILLYLLWYPLKIVVKQNRILVVIFITYLSLCFMTLEPITWANYISIIMFYCLTLSIAKNKEFVH